jgi:hypothetical protein
MYADTSENKDGLQPKLADSILKMIDAWSEVGHSGGSAMWTREIVHKLLGYEALTPTTNDPDEWEDVSEINGSPMWQNKRDSRNFSKDGGKTWFNIDDKPDTPEDQIKKLTDFIMHNIPGEPSESEGAVDTAIRLLTKLKNR